MIDELLKSKIAVVGGGRFCKNLLELLYSEHFEDQRPSILGVADKDDQAEGLLYAGRKGIFTTCDYRELFELENLQIIMELTADDKLSVKINMTKPDKVRLIDHIECRTIWTSLQVEAEKRKALKVLGRHKDSTHDINVLFEQFADRLGDVITQRSNRYVEIERELIESEIALSQIIEGSTIPTFVLNQDHIVTHWNT
ncbi:MAG: hypothetical protein KJP23_04160, partial [Deltaproteobacteria bacterium]|nr:hypothetical protein [Deltaproteobacteria bacterium]